MTRDNRRIALTESGHYLWVVMMREFFTGVGSLRDSMRHHIADEHAYVAADSARVDCGNPQ